MNILKQEINNLPNLFFFWVFSSWICVQVFCEVYSFFRIYFIFLVCLFFGDYFFICIYFFLHVYFFFHAYFFFGNIFFFGVYLFFSFYFCFILIAFSPSSSQSVLLVSFSLGSSSQTSCLVYNPLRGWGLWVVEEAAFLKLAEPIVIAKELLEEYLWVNRFYPVLMCFIFFFKYFLQFLFFISDISVPLKAFPRRIITKACYCMLFVIMVFCLILSNLAVVTFLHGKSKIVRHFHWYNEESLKSNLLVC